MAEKERLGKTSAKSLSVGGVPVAKRFEGSVSVTGTATVTAPAGISAITSATATLITDPSLTGNLVSCAISGTSVTIKVWKPTASGDCTPIAATAAKTVHYSIAGS